MAEQEYIERKVTAPCHGRAAGGADALQNPVMVEATLYQSPGVTDSFGCYVQCPYNTGGHGERCKASHPEQDKVVPGVSCLHSFFYPQVLEAIPSWVPPTGLAETVEEMKQRLK